MDKTYINKSDQKIFLTIKGIPVTWLPNKELIIDDGSFQRNKILYDLLKYNKIVLVKQNITDNLSNKKDELNTTNNLSNKKDELNVKKSEKFDKFTKNDNKNDTKSDIDII